MFFSINPKISNAVVNGRCQKVSKDDLLNENDRNLSNIACRRCGSIVFPEDAVEYIEGYPLDLRVMTHQAVGPAVMEKVSCWWFTKDDMAFDTVGWQTVDKKKVLMCGDCELGPIGYRTDDNKRFYVAVERMAYKSSPNDDDEEEEPKKKPIPPPTTRQNATKQIAPTTRPKNQQPNMTPQKNKQKPITKK